MEPHFQGVCDDFHFSTRLFLKLDVPTHRETVLHFFERLQREFPRLSRMRRKENGTLVLEEQERGLGPRRWVRLDQHSLKFGHFAPADLSDLTRLSELILEQAPYHLGISPLDLDRMEVSFGFDLEYRGNHDQLVADALLGEHPLGQLLAAEGADGRNGLIALDCQPYFGMALNPTCDLQAYFEVKGRTSTFEVRTQEFETQPITVSLTVRKYFGYGEQRSLAEEHAQMLELASELSRNRAIPLLVRPLAQAIAANPQ